MSKPIIIDDLSRSQIQDAERQVSGSAQLYLDILSGRGKPRCEHIALVATGNIFRARALVNAGLLKAVEEPGDTRVQYYYLPA